MTAGIVFDVREFTIHDRPGIRTTVFVKGCPLACTWCHNPEGLDPAPQLALDSELITRREDDALLHHELGFDLRWDNVAVVGRRYGW